MSIFVVPIEVLLQQAHIHFRRSLVCLIQNHVLQLRHERPHLGHRLTMLNHNLVSQLLF